MRRGGRSQTDASPLPPDRKLLKEMTSQEFIDWSASRSAELADFSEYVGNWMRRRAGSGRQNYHDRRYAAFQGLAADLVAALDELREERELAAAHQKEEERDSREQEG
jgi:hypothetical protein